MIWGTPWAISHNGLRGNCLNEVDPGFPKPNARSRPKPRRTRPQAYLTLPSLLRSPAEIHRHRDLLAAVEPGDEDLDQPARCTRCDELGFNPNPRGTLSTNRASSPTGFEFTLDGNSQPLLVPASRATSQVKKAVGDIAGGDVHQPVGRPPGSAPARKPSTRRRRSTRLPEPAAPTTRKSANW